ncbi:TDT family transporter, partial [Vibrio parahaemolyticus]|nr:TDT family transporter [Vibrio parahaemolyticus]
WFIVYVGIVAGSVSSKAFGYESIGRILFYFGLISFIVLLPVIIKRVFVVKEIPEPALPTIAIMTAPAGLLLAGYMNVFENKSYAAVLALLIISQILYIYVLTRLPKLLSLKFYPSYSAFTFPTVITAIGIKGATNYLKGVNESLSFLTSVALIEEIIAVLLVVYVLIRY